MLIAQRSLYQQVARVRSAFAESGLVEARAAVSRIVGRDPDQLDEAGVSRAAPISFPRQALHAEEIAFAHPATGVRMSIRAPVPPDMQQLIRTLRQAGTRTAKSPASA